MKSLFLLATLAFATPVQAESRSGSCVMGTGQNAVRVILAIESSVVQVSYEGAEDDKTRCVLGSNSNYDYYITCDGDTDEDDMVIRIKSATGTMIDSAGATIARLTNCRIR